MARILTVSRKKTKILTVNHKRHHPTETLLYLRLDLYILLILQKTHLNKISDILQLCSSKAFANQ